MTQAQFLLDLNTALVQVVFVLSVLFIVGVSIIWPWWKQDLGWTIVLKTACIAAVLLLPVAHDWFNVSLMNLPMEWVSTISFALVGVIIVWRGLVIWILQRYGSMSEEADSSLLRRWTIMIHNRRGEKASASDKELDNA